MDRQATSIGVRAGRHCAALAMALAAPLALAQQQVSPDRPSSSDSSFTVAPGFYQIESGLVHAKGDARRSSIEMLARVGLAQNLELRIGTEPIVRVADGDDETGFGDVQVAAKYRFIEASGARPSFALEPFVKLPSASRPIGTNQTDFGITLIASRSWSSGYSADLNIGAIALGQRGHGDYRGQLFTSLAVGRSLGDKLSVYGEAFHYTPEESGGGGITSADAGLVYLLSDRIALDAAVEAGLSHAADDYTVRAGVTFLLGGR